MRTRLTLLALCAVAIGSIAGCGSASTTTTPATTVAQEPALSRRPRTPPSASQSGIEHRSCPRRPIPACSPAQPAPPQPAWFPPSPYEGRRRFGSTDTRTWPCWSFDQRLVDLRLHSGTVDAGSTGWRFGPVIAGTERRQLVAAFNGGFKLDVGAGGFESYGRVGSPLSDGLGSIVTYADGSTDIGSWHHGVPAPGRPVVSVRQNLHLLIDGGRPAANLGCLLCWGATLHGVIAPARSALGITADGHLVWAGGENLTVQDLADALLGAKVVRAVELDINPEWVAAYLYGHRGGNRPAGPGADRPGPARRAGTIPRTLHPRFLHGSSASRHRGMPPRRRQNGLLIEQRGESERSSARCTRKLPAAGAHRVRHLEQRLVSIASSSLKATTNNASWMTGSNPPRHSSCRRRSACGCSPCITSGDSR